MLCQLEEILAVEFISELKLFELKGAELLAYGRYFIGLK